MAGRLPLAAVGISTPGAVGASEPLPAACDAEAGRRSGKRSLCDVDPEGSWADGGDEVRKITCRDSLVGTSLSGSYIEGPLLEAFGGGDGDGAAGSSGTLGGVFGSYDSALDVAVVAGDRCSSSVGSSSSSPLQRRGRPAGQSAVLLRRLIRRQRREDSFAETEVEDEAETDVGHDDDDVDDDDDDDDEDEDEDEEGSREEALAGSDTNDDLCRMYVSRRRNALCPGTEDGDKIQTFQISTSLENIAI